jgi:hypothetical protein
MDREEYFYMWTDTPESKQLVIEVSRELVADIAPEELELVDELLDDYYAHPTVHEAKDDPLGFGSELLAASTEVPPLWKDHEPLHASN